MQELAHSNLIKLLSKERLAGYATAYAKMKCKYPLNLYMWNMALAECLYSLLQTVEIGLRNSINEAMIQKFATNKWLLNDNILQNREIMKVRECLAKFSIDAAAINTNRVIAELSFGFWTSLLDIRYELVWHKIIKTTFPYMPRNIRTRGNASKQFANIRILRNMVFHFEPIWHWKDLGKQHNNVVDAIKWLDPELLLLVDINRFKNIYTKGPQQENYIMLKEHYISSEKQPEIIN